MWWCVKRDLDKISELKHQLVKISKREEHARKQLSEQKKAAEALAASSASKLAAAQKEKLELTEAIDKVNVTVIGLPQCGG